MSYEFKRLSDVEVVVEPTESANVLIEEDGVIKKAPKTAVGSKKGGSLMLYPCMVDDTIKIDRTYDEIKDVLDNGGVVLMSELPIVINDAGGFYLDIVMENVLPLYYGLSVETDEGNIIIFISSHGSTDSIMYLKSDNTFVISENSSGGGPA